MIAIVIILAIYLRFYNLAIVPNGLYPDESAIGYNAYSILQTGKDEYGIAYPLYFKSFDDFKLPVYIYLTAISINFFGENAFSVRFASALFGSLSVVGLMSLIYLLSKNKALTALTGIFITFNPWHLYFSRAGYEVNVATAFILFGVLFFVLATKYKLKLLFLALSVTFFVLSVYTYNVTRLIAPLILLGLIFFYYKSFKVKKVIFMALSLFFVGMLPFIFSFIALQSQSGFSAHSDSLIIGNATKAEIVETRSYFISLPPVIQKIFFNYYTLVAWTYLKNLVNFFSTSFYFIEGSDKPNQNINLMAMFYYFEFPLIIAGIYYAIKRKAKTIKPFAVWLVIVFLFGSLAKVYPNGTRTFPAVIPLVALSAFGLFSLISYVLKLKNLLFRNAALFLITALVLYSYSYFLLSYFVRSPIENAVDWRSEDKKATEYILQIEDGYDKVVFLEPSGFFYTSFLFYGSYPPEKHHDDSSYKQSGLVTTLERTGKFYFTDIDFSKEEVEKDTLYISHKHHVPEGVEVIKEFNYPIRPIGIYYDRKIGQLSVEDSAYVLFEKL